MPSLRAQIPKQPPEETFVWYRKPTVGSIWHPTGAGLPRGSTYMDGSLLRNESKYYGLAATRGWAVAVMDEDGDILAAAHGRPPAWAQGIHATELWSLLMSFSVADPFSRLHTDCSAVFCGANRSSEWANSPARPFGRAWGPIAANFEGDPSRLVWMPAHCTAAQVSSKKLSTGEPMTQANRRGNSLVDWLAKEAALWDQLHPTFLKLIKSEAALVTAIAICIGQCGVLANHFPFGRTQEGKQTFVRDSEGIQRRIHKPRQKRKLSIAGLGRTPGDLSLCPRWAALRQRIIDKAGIG